MSISIVMLSLVVLTVTMPACTEAQPVRGVPKTTGGKLISAQLKGLSKDSSDKLLKSILADDGLQSVEAALNASVENAFILLDLGSRGISAAIGQDFVRGSIDIETVLMHLGMDLRGTLTPYEATVTDGFFEFYYDIAGGDPSEIYHKLMNLPYPNLLTHKPQFLLLFHDMLTDTSFKRFLQGPHGRASSFLSTLCDSWGDACGIYAEGFGGGDVAEMVLRASSTGKAQWHYGPSWTVNVESSDDSAHSVLRDMKLSTVWIQPVSGGFKNVALSIEFVGPTDVSQVVLFPGNSADRESFWAYSRIREAEVSLEDTSFSVSREDRFGGMVIPVHTRTQRIEMEITKTYAGSGRDALAIGEVFIVQSINRSR